MKAMETITSRQNAKIKQARALRWRKVREETGLFLVEGIRHVGDAISAGALIERIFYAPDLLTSDFAYGLIQQANKRGVLCYKLSSDVFKSLAEKVGPQGILVVVRQTPTPLAELTPQNFPWGVALMAPQDPGNIGTILRTIDAVGANGLILLDGGTDPWHPTAVRASMGQLFWLPVVQTSFDDFKSWVEEHDYHVYGTSARGEVDYLEITYSHPCVLLLGSEREGLSVAQAAICERIARVPMVGRLNSLNLAVAAGVILFEMKKARRPDVIL